MHVCFVYMWSTYNCTLAVRSVALGWGGVSVVYCVCVCCSKWGAINKAMIGLSPTPGSVVAPLPAKWLH